MLQKQQITTFPHYVKKSLFLTFCHISVILADLSFSPFSSFFQKSPFFTFFARSAKITIFTKIPVFLEIPKIPKIAKIAVFPKMANFGVFLEMGKNRGIPGNGQNWPKSQKWQKWGFGGNTPKLRFWRLRWRTHQEGLM